MSSFDSVGEFGVVFIYLRRFIPESPRWLMTHGQREAAERIVARIEADAAAEHGIDLSPTPDPRRTPPSCKHFGARQPRVCHWRALPRPYLTFPDATPLGRRRAATCSGIAGSH